MKIFGVKNHVRMCYVLDLDVSPEVQRQRIRGRALGGDWFMGTL